MSLMIPINTLPFSIRLYSTVGGTAGYTLRCKILFSSSSRQFSVKVLVLIPSISFCNCAKRCGFSANNKRMVVRHFLFNMLLKQLNGHA